MTDYGMERSEFANYIWEQKYKAPQDANIDDSFKRVAKVLSEGDSDFESSLYEELSSGRFVPAGRIFAGAGVPGKYTLFNCFVSSTIEDSMEGIFNVVKEAAITQKYGGGIGFDFSTIRPAQSKINDSTAPASGPLSFMRVFDTMCSTVMSGNSRRGAMMGILNVDHPDILDFIKIKGANSVIDKVEDTNTRRELYSNFGNLRNFNISVGITDTFMEAVRKDQFWDLQFDGVVYNTIAARVLWDQILNQTYNYSEPGIFFVDTANRLNNLSYCEKIAATNPSMPAGTLVHTNLGIFAIDKLEGKSFKVKSMDGTWVPANCFLSSESADLIEITFGPNRTIRCTKEHKWPVLLNGSYVRVSADKLNIGDLIPTNRNESLELSNRVDLSYTDGLITGIVFGNGYYNIRKDDGRAYLGISFNQEDLELQELAAQYFSVNKTQQHDELTLHVTKDKVVRSFLEKVGLTLGSKEQLPTTLWESNDNFIKGFIDGLFSTDGCVYKDDIVLTNKNKNVMVEVAKLLAFHGVLSTIREGVTHLNGKAFNRYDLTISKNSAKRFATVFKLTSIRKGKKLKELINTHCRKHINADHLVVKEIKYLTNKERVWDISVDYYQHVFPTEWGYTGNCGEQGLPSNGNCNLGAINLSRFVTNPFTTDARFDEVLLQKTVQIAVRALDNVIDVTQYPIPEQEKEGKNKRRIGLGFMGLATVFQMLGCTYGDSNSIAHTNFIMKRIANYAYAESANIAKEKGAFPLYDREAILKAPFVNNKLTKNVRDDISKYGLRNGVILTVAPTGTTALAFGDNCTSGIEPAFALSYSRNVRIGGGDEYKSYDIEDYGVRLFKHLYPGLEIPKHVKDSVTENLTITNHLDILENVQYWIDASVSKTINVPQSYSFEDFKSVYESAYDRNCKGCTTYRPSDVRGSILSTAPAENKKETAVVPIVAVDKRPSVLDSKTYYIPAWPDDNCSRYVTIADLEDGRPWEIFIATKATTSSAETMALARIISALMRRTDDVSYIADVLSEVHSPTGGSWIDGKYIPSLPAAYGAILKRHIEKKHDIFVNKEKKTVAVKGKLCNHCGEYSLISQDGCNQCLNCGYSKCG